MLSAEVIELAHSDWDSQIVINPKKDGTPRFCIYYRCLNETTVPDAYLVPCMDDFIDSLGSSTIYTALDVNWGYSHVPIAEEDRDKTTFVSQSATFRCKRMPFGLGNSPDSS